MKKFILPLLALLVVCASTSWADPDRSVVVSRVTDSGDVLSEIMNAPDRGIPQEIMESAECVAVVPSMLKGGFVFGALYGHGVVTCRTSTGWSAPAFFRLEGGSFGLQIGGQAVDLVMLVMNRRGMEALLSDHFKLGADASAAAGPVGRHAEGMTDWKMKAEVLTYSRARGLFAGVTLNGTAVAQDKGDTRAFYGHMVPFRSLLTGEVQPPSDARPFLSEVEKYNTVAVRVTPPAPVAPATSAAPATAPAASAPSTTAAPTAAPATAAPAETTQGIQDESQAQPIAAPAASVPADSYSASKPSPANPHIR